MLVPFSILLLLLLLLPHPTLTLNPSSPVIYTNAAGLTSPLSGLTPYASLTPGTPLAATVHNTTSAAAFLDIRAYRLTGRSRGRAVRVYGYMPLRSLPEGWTLQNRAVRKAKDRVLRNGDAVDCVVVSCGLGRVSVCVEGEYERVRGEADRKRARSRAWRRR